MAESRVDHTQHAIVNDQLDWSTAGELDTTERGKDMAKPERDPCTLSPAYTGESEKRLDDTVAEVLVDVTSSVRASQQILITRHFWLTPSQLWEEAPLSKPECQNPDRIANEERAGAISHSSLQTFAKTASRMGCGCETQGEDIEKWHCR